MATPRSNYLYGDSTESTLQTNFLEFLRDSIDFSVAAIRADLRIDDARAKVNALRAEAERQSSDLETFVKVVTAAIDGAHKEPDTATLQCAVHLSSLTQDALRTFQNVIATKLQADIAHAEAEESAARDASMAALGALLAPHEPPDSKTSLKLTLTQGGYQGTSEGSSALGLAWGLSVTPPEGHPWSQPIRVGRFAPGLEITVPQLVSGWLSKEMKLLPHKIDGYVVSDFSDAGATRQLRLRADLSADAGFLLEMDTARKTVRVSRFGGAEGSEELTIPPEEVPRLLDLVEKVAETATGFTAAGLSKATVDGNPFRELPNFRAFVERLVGTLAPVTRVISERSLMPTELVIRKLLGNDRREEIFVAKAALREKYASLPETERALFSPLGLEPAPRTDMPPGVSVRAELAPSRVPPPRTSVPPPPPTAIPGALSNPPGPESIAARPDSLKATMRRIIALGKSGDADAAYREYANLFMGATFADNKIEDQRLSLRLLVLGKTPTQASDALLEAFKAALPRLSALVAISKEPGDYEMLGVCNVLLKNTDDARTAFTTGLELEKQKSTTSDLFGNLTRRLGEL
ncbi:MAG: hypothetical protein U0174_25460 [Polyangiaceae bacterium]